MVYGEEKHRFGNASRGRKSKAGGKIIKGYGIIYTPDLRERKREKKRERERRG